MVENFSYLFKCTIFGDYEVGKKTLINQVNEARIQRVLKLQQKKVDKRIDEYQILREKTKRRSKKRNISNKIEKLIESKHVLEQRTSIINSTLLITGVDFCHTNVKFRNDYAKLQLWVLSNQERYQSLLPNYVSNSIGAIIMYDITNSNSLNRISEWCHLIREVNGNIPILLVGNKLDLEDLREISIEQGTKIKQELQLSAFMEISVKTGENFKKMFEKLAKFIVGPIDN